MRWGTRAQVFFFFFNDTATTEIYTLSLHDALPIYPAAAVRGRDPGGDRDQGDRARVDRKSTRLNSSHLVISYAVFCLKKKNLNTTAFPPLSDMTRTLTRSSLIVWHDSHMHMTDPYI